jgi:hypothetical protein
MAQNLARGQMELIVNRNEKHSVGWLFPVIVRIPGEVVELFQLMLVILKINLAVALSAHVVLDGEFATPYTPAEETLVKHGYDDEEIAEK